MIQLIIGLANPGKEYVQTRHNAGVWFINALLSEFGASLQLEKKMKATLAKLQCYDHIVRFAVPTVYMNLSGETVQALINFYKFSPQQILVVHDEIDLPPGVARLKFAGGEGGHNGLRSIVSAIGSKNFHRLRIGVGHPGNSHQVADYVLKAPSIQQRQQIDQAIDDARSVMPMILNNQFEQAMQRLHTS